MSTQTITSCDVSGETHEGDVRHATMSVILTTETTEGRAVKPYLSIEKLDICDKCHNRIIRSHTLLEATGAQGYYEFYFAKGRK